MTIVGIDLGTTNSAVAVIEAGQPVVLPGPQGSPLLPSVVAWSPIGEVMVGEVARRYGTAEPMRAVHSVKRFMGRRLTEAEGDARRVHYPLAAADNGEVRVVVDGHLLAPPWISAQVLRELKARAEEALGAPVTEAVITVPAYFDDDQRRATRDAGALAGLTVRRIVNEPTAAAMAYGLDRAASGRVAVYDLGGGTFDVSLLEIGAGTVEVRATNGDTSLGGDDFDAAMVELLLEGFAAPEVRAEPAARARLREAAEAAKIALSSAERTTVRLPFLAHDAQGQPLHLEVTVARSRFEAAINDLVRRTGRLCRQALRDAGWKATELDAVLMVGGSTHVPAVQAAVAEIFGQAPRQGVDPELAVALGAAVQAGVLEGTVTDLLLLDVTPLSLGIETLGGVTDRLIARNTPVPCSTTQYFSTGQDHQTSVTIQVVQGERQMAADNRLLGEFTLEGIPPQPRGVPRIAVTFELDADGVLQVSAVDTATGLTQGMTVSSQVGLGAEELARMVAEAERLQRDDAQRAAVGVAQRELARDLAEIEGDLDELRAHLGDEAAARVEQGVERCRQALEDGNDKELERAMKALQKLAGELERQAARQHRP